MDNITIFQFDEDELKNQLFKFDYQYINIDLTQSQLEELRCYIDSFRFGSSYADELSDFFLLKMKLKLKLISILILIWVI